MPPQKEIYSIPEEQGYVEGSIQSDIDEFEDQDELEDIGEIEKEEKEEDSSNLFMVDQVPVPRLTKANLKKFDISHS